jgi:TonB-linked SusC/RagA family outer membrane protein
VGYPNVEMPVNNQTTIDVSMSTEGEEIEEIVVVGYGTVKRANVTGAVSSLNASEIQDIPVASLSKALEGRLAGVKIGQSSGKPGALTSLKIRESTSYSEATEDPLYVIDGIIRDKEAFDMLDPNEVESISILKDASASVYGVRAAGGVVLVQTKRGKEGKIKVSYNGTTGITEAINVTEMLSAYDHAMMLNDGYRASELSLSDDRYYADDELSYFRSIPGGGYDWLGGAWQSTIVTRHNMNVSGGSKTVRYYVGGSYYHETGAIEGLQLNKYSLRSNIEVDVFEGLTASFSVNLDNREDRTPINPLDTQNDLMEETFRALLQNPKWIPPTINVDGVDYPVYQRGQIENNPYAIWANNEYKANESGRSNYVAAINYKIPGVEGLSTRLQFSQTKGNGYGKTYYERAYAYNFQTEGTHNHIIRPDAAMVDSIPKQLVSSKESLEESSERSFSYQLNASVSYARKIGLHDIHALLVAEVSENESNRVGWQREGAQVVPNVDQLWAFQEKDRILSPNVNSGGSLGYIGRINYNYGNRYVGEFSFRYDGSSTFSPELRWGFFPAGAIGWIVSEESFFKENVDFIDFFKLRASAGLLGNDGVKEFLWKYSFGAVTSSGVLFGNQPTNGIEAKNGGFANPDISWQKTQSYNGGLDMKLWNNKVGVGVDGFYKYTYDILAPITNTNPTTVGIPANSKIPFNYGIMHAYGCEVEVGYYDKLPFDINYYVKGNFAWSKAMKLKVAQSPGAIGTWHDELKNNVNNQPGAINTGIVRTGEEIQEILMDNPNYRVQAEPIQAGKINYKDIRGADGTEGPNGIFSNNMDEDRTVIAALTSPPYTYGISLGLSWKGVKVDATFSGKFGHNDFYNKDDHALPNATHNVPAFWKDHWTPENPNAAFPRVVVDAMTEQHSTFWMVDGHTLRLTDLNVSYSLPHRWAEKFGIPQLRIYFDTQNLWTVINPFDYKDANLSRYNGYPMTRTYTFGLNFTL